MMVRKAFVALVVTVVGLWTIVASASDPYFVNGRYDRQQVIDQDLKLDPGGQLKVQVDDVDVYLQPGDKPRLEVFVSGPDLDEAIEYYNEHVQFVVDNDDSRQVVIETKEMHNRHDWSWERYRDVRVWAVVTVPKHVNIDLRTQDGDVQVDELEGATEIETTDGDVRIGALAGQSVRLETQDGDIRVDKIDVATVELRTSDGNLDINAVTAKTVAVRSADGDIELPKLEADDITLECDDGDVGVGARGKHLSASVGDGDLDVELLVAMEASLRARDGDISLVVPAKEGANLDLRGGDVHMRGDVRINGSVSHERVVGSINDGGPLVRAKTNDGTIRVNLR